MMIEPTLVKKLRLTPEQRLAVLNAPDWYLPQLQSHLTFSLSIDSALVALPYDTIQIFVTNRAMLESSAATVIHGLKPRGLAWFTYPKRSGPLAGDLARDHGWEILETLGWDFVTLISLNDVWSAHLYREPGDRRRR